MNEETKLKAKCLKVLKEKGLLHFKLSDKFYSGIPDILIIKEGKAVWVELKTPTGVLSEIQKWTIGKLRDNGCYCYVVRSLEEFKEAVRGICLYKN